MGKDKLEKLIEELQNFEQLKFESIPDIDLYMDQVTTFIEDKLGYLKRNKEDSTITKTMINNYTKAGILMPPKKKKYSRQHMVLIILTYYLKQILSISDIQSLFSPMVNSIMSGESREESLSNVYKKFLKIEDNEVKAFVEDFQNKLKEQNISNLNLENGSENLEENLDELLVMVIMLVVKANIEKRMAEKIIDNFFKK
ncbi:DUF1836 domain-containing protein [Clostridium luticellarii]|uniref:DUF1836 domain-containing protein n=1 Tax=Clostridium luticellarii TaxID=1691940 RepID=A0A2T0BT12_9CLOT|nr:DUF1836 domain-containing protein [Clostridium luticellarii]MCI1946054.1 DUF1836 domain-containing protein [Clostridium luticellarii]MCI1969716.1 DUF1836 domain-containing protein [Clostridium luticellarii]MCI1995466.1 DUF1836 domain-containing protein [Clostridium luticellarii]MCI2040622.1 DUF1836 domain-containing protein [Clostridium luticellarii]PRR86955.1 hypothetical protein CLLU_01360 [Clostridium luticellarii]